MKETEKQINEMHRLAKKMIYFWFVFVAVLSLFIIAAGAAVVINYIIK